MSNANVSPRSLVRLVAVVAVTATCMLLALLAHDAKAYTFHWWCQGCHMSSGMGSASYGPGVSGLVRTTNYSTGSAEAGTGINSSGQYYTTCSGAGCTADTGDFNCGDWFSGAQPFGWSHSGFADNFNAAYYTC
jgi:hypothetical protein